MILVTVGTQLPFDRLVEAVDAWAAAAGRDDVLFQVGHGGRTPARGRWVERLAPDELRARVAEAEAVVAHAGMGTVLTARELGAPLLVLPRRAALGEHRSDHQLATARTLRARGGVGVAMDEGELALALARLDELPRPEPLPSLADAPLVTALREFLAA